MTSTAQETRFSCACGTLSGHIRDLSPTQAVHAVCYCTDCCAADRYLGQPDPIGQGVNLVLLSPSDIAITTGDAHLALMRLYPNGLLRWYAACCATPLFTTPTTAKVRMASLRTSRLDQPNHAGPVVARAFVPQKTGKGRHVHPMRMFWPIAVRSLAGLMSGDWRDTPFFDPQTRLPVREATVLTGQDRRRLGLGRHAHPSVRTSG